MRILIEILHPAHVHFFRNAIATWRARGDVVLVVSREKEMANELLSAYQIPYRSISALGTHKWQLLLEMLERDAKMTHLALSFKPDVLVGIMGVTIVQVGLLLRRPAIVFYDTENATITNRFVYPLAHSVCTPQCYAQPVRGNHVVYPGYHELAYLHPDRFAADPEIVRRAGLDPERRYFLLRFVSWQASHDLSERGLDLEWKRELVKILAPLGEVLISSEGPLPTDLEAHRFRARPEHIHHILAFAALLVGESATMASEAAMLGVPSFYIADTGRGYVSELADRYGLIRMHRLSESARALDEVRSLLKNAHLRAEYQERRSTMLSERVDTTSWMVAYIDAVLARNS